MIHSTQEAFSHSTSCITHEVLTELCTHSPFPLAVSSWHPAQGKMNKLFRPFSASFALFPSFCLSRLWLCSHRLEVTGMEMGCRRESRQPLLQPQPAFGAKPGHPAGCAGETGCVLRAHNSTAVHYSGPCV